MEKVYTVSPMTKDNDLFEVTLYEDEEEVAEYAASKENLDKLIEKVEADGYEREYEWNDNDDDYDIMELRDQWNACDDD